MPYKFNTPFEKQGPLGSHRLWQFYGLERGISVVKTGDGYYETQSVSQEEMDAAEMVYLGGSEYVVSDQEAAELTAAGYSEFLEII